MANSNFVVKNGLTVNGSFTANSTAVNAAAITATSVNATSVNAATLSIAGVSVANLITGNATSAYSNAVANAAALYQTTAGLSANVATLTANATTFLGNSSGTVANIASWVTGNAASAYSNAVANAAALYQTTAGLSANVATLTSNNSTNFGGLSLATVQGQITGNATTAYTNAITVAAATYQTTAGLSANVATLSANNTTYLNGQLASYYTNATNLSSGTVATARLASGTANSTTYLRGDQTWATVSAGGGTVTSVGTGTGLSGGPITTTGTISLATAGAGAASYSSGISALTVDAYGRVTSVTGSAGYATQSYVTSQGYVTSSGVTSITAGTGLSGGTITSTGTISLSTVAISSGGTGSTTASGARTNLAVLGTAGGTMTGRLYMQDTGIRVGQDTTDQPGNGNSTVGGAWQFSSSTLGTTIYLSRGQFAGLRLNQNTNGDNCIDFFKSGSAVGSVSVTTTGTSYNTSSDYRLKENFEPIVDAIGSVNSLPAWKFGWKKDPSASKTHGFIAHEAQAIVPEAVTGEKDGEQMQMLDYSKLVPVLWAAVQELSAKVNSLEAQLNSK